MDSSALTLRYRQSQPAPHELETLMSAGAKHPAITAGQQSLMGRDVRREGLVQDSLSSEVRSQTPPPPVPECIVVCMCARWGGHSPHVTDTRRAGGMQLEIRMAQLSLGTANEGSSSLPPLKKRPSKEASLEGRLNYSPLLQPNRTRPQSEPQCGSGGSLSQDVRLCLSSRV